VDRATLICRKKFIEESALLLPGTADQLGRGVTSGNDRSSDEHTGEGTFYIKNPIPLKDVENAYLEWMLKRFDGNRTRCAKALGISIRGLRYKLNTEGEKN
ncbi:MAG: helix-turn-helix domain-containing protein, partial [Spirochaetaceae bacterium]|nr:helix-turn-helix domain-containing protein [Spirochaetaceae bacterium]